MSDDYCTQHGTEEIAITRQAGDWRKIQCAACGAIDELDRMMDELERNPHLSYADRADQIDGCLSARSALDRLVTAIAEATKEVRK